MNHITKDLFGVVNRLKKINPSYNVFYNNCLERFEVHTSKTPTAFTFAFIPPYDELDARTIEYALKTRVQNLDHLEREIDLHNRRLEQKSEREFVDKQNDLADMLAFANRTGHDVMFTKNHIKEF